MENSKEYDEFWEKYLDTLPSDESKSETYEYVFSFGDSPEMADELGQLVVEGAKTATASSLWRYEQTEEAVPKVGDFSIVLDGDETPLCVIETVEANVVRFDEVDEQFALDEGEGFQSVEDWQEGHWEYFSRTLPEIGLSPSESMPVVCERFRVIY